MYEILSLLPLLLACVVYGLLVKLAARLYQGSRLSWKHAFAFGALVMLLGGAGALLNQASGLPLGPLMGVVLSLALQLALGGWFLGPRALAANGTAVAFKGGVLISAMAFAMVFALGVVAAVLVPLLGSGRPA